MDAHEMTVELVRLSRNIDAGLTALRQSSQEYAIAERDYRKAKAEAWVAAADFDGLAAAREAHVNAQTADQRYLRDLADGARRVALEAVRARQAQMSALQSLMNAHRSEAELARTGPR